MTGNGDTDLANAIVETVHDLNNTLGVMRLTVDLLADGALDAPAAAESLSEQIDQALTVLTGLRQQVPG